MRINQVSELDNDLDSIDDDAVDTTDGELEKLSVKPSTRQLEVRRRIEDIIERKRLREEFGDDLD